MSGALDPPSGKGASGGGSDEALLRWMALARVEGVGPVLFRRLLDRFGTVEEALGAPVPRVAEVEGVGASLAERVLRTLDLPGARRELDRLDRMGGRALRWDDPAYPALLRRISDPPPILYVRGTPEPAEEPRIAVVGARMASDYGRAAAQEIARGLARAGVCVLSGLARGVDGSAHQAALRAGGRTLAVMGSGLDVLYPHEHRRLAESIREHGALVTEFPLGTGPDAGNFPRRNRIVSGMSLGVVVVEAREKSGALNTARHALDQGREVFAVPGSIFSARSRGAHRLLRDGATVATSAADVLLEVLPHLAAPPSPEPCLPLPEGEAGSVLRALTDAPLTADEVGRRTGFTASRTAALLTDLEIEGQVERIPGGRYARTPHG